MSLQEDNLPVLSEVVETGNRSIIQSTRMGNEVLRELEFLRQDSVRRIQKVENQDAQDTVTAPEDTSESATLEAVINSDKQDCVAAPKVEPPQGLDFERIEPSTDEPSINEPRFEQASAEEQSMALSDDDIEFLIDDVVDRHITALRQDIKQLLERARRKP